MFFVLEKSLRIGTSCILYNEVYTILQRVHFSRRGQKAVKGETPLSQRHCCSQLNHHHLEDGDLECNKPLLH